MTSGHDFDLIVIGGGIAGASAASALAGRHRVLLLERESHFGVHSTGRSAAIYIETYGGPVGRALTVAGRGFFLAPPDGFADAPLVRPLGAMHVGAPAHLAELDRLFDAVHTLSPDVRRIDRDQALALCPVLRPEICDGAVFEPGAMDIDVNSLHQGYLRQARRLGAILHTGTAVDAIARTGRGWRVIAGEREFTASIVVNAAGAWADEIATMAGARPLGLKPLRRTAITFDPPAGLTVHGWPSVFDVAGQWYLKPDAGRIMASPADEHDSPPCDAQPEEYDVAVAAERIERATTLNVRRLVSRWAGLRVFAPDREPVIGFDDGVQGFFWIAGAGGTGIQNAPGCALAVSGLIDTGQLPDALTRLGLTREGLSRTRQG